MRHTLITPQKKPPDIPLQALTDDVYLDPSDGLLHCCTCHMPRQKHMIETVNTSDRFEAVQSGNAVFRGTLYKDHT